VQEERQAQGLPSEELTRSEKPISEISLQMN
jgi:hypothetical protein